MHRSRTSTIIPEGACDAAAKIIYLCQGGRTLQRSDRDDSEVRTL
jgi:hypothetical protein